ncbi:MAG TPA: hypothetical protein PLL64_09670 [Rhodothermales bacterium]|nr:hypothetical protein [Rhodothermales bacterium]HRR08581.1 hypothetical protein [Rhodothermales bacterium]
MKPLAQLFVFFLPILFFGACTPSLTPPYRDYRATPRESALDKAKTAFKAAGWEVKDGVATGVIATQERQIRDFKAYKILVKLEATTFQSRFVRVYIHAYRKYLISGHKGKIPYMERHVIHDVLHPLEAALKNQGMELEKRLSTDDKTRY